MSRFRGLIVILSVLVFSSGAMASSYFIYSDWGGTWHDAEKSPTNTEDDLMCWAAAASNVLAWTGWGLVGGMTNADEMFAHFQDHWTDEGGNPYFGWDWWFDGTNDTQGVSGWSQEDVDGGGGFYPTLTYTDYVLFTSADATALSAIDYLLHNGYGSTLSLTSSTVGHSITVWGYDYDGQGNYTGIWVTDSDDDKYDSTPEDELRYYDVLYSGGRWYLQDYYGYNDIYISEVIGLQKMPIVPEPATLSLLELALAGLAARRRMRG